MELDSQLPEPYKKKKVVRDTSVSDSDPNKSNSPTDIRPPVLVTVYLAGEQTGKTITILSKVILRHMTGSDEWRSAFSTHEACDRRQMCIIREIHNIQTVYDAQPPSRVLRVLSYSEK